MTLDDLNFINITSEHVEDFFAGRRPFGMGPKEYRFFCDELRKALKLDKISECDVRIQGSCGRFFSGKHKTMPWTRPELLGLANKLWDELVSSFELDRAQEMLAERWPEGAPRPLRRPIDVLYVIGVDPKKSDIDVQLSSDDGVALAREELTARGADPDEFEVADPKYNFVDRKFVESSCRNLAFWAAEMTRVTGREVNLALFGSTGPPDHSGDGTGVSSHFQADDWCLGLDLTLDDL